MRASLYFQWVRSATRNEIRQYKTATKQQKKLESVDVGDEIKGVCEKRSVENIGDDWHSKDTKKRRRIRKEADVVKPSIIVKVENNFTRKRYYKCRGRQASIPKHLQKGIAKFQLSTMSFQMETVKFM